MNPRNTNLRLEISTTSRALVVRSLRFFGLNLGLFGLRRKLGYGNLAMLAAYLRMNQSHDFVDYNI